MKILRVLQEVDRRYLYAALLLAVMLPFLMDVKIPVPISAQTNKMYTAIEELPPNSFVLFGVDWSAGTRGENGAQTEVLMRHLMRHKVRFALLAFDPQSKELCQRIAQRLQTEYGYKEGVNWVNWGYRVSSNLEMYLKALAQDIPTAVGTDIHEVPVRTLPVMAGIQSAKDIALILDVTPSSTFQAYIQFVAQPYKIPMGIAPTAVMAPEAFTYLDSGQIVGMLAGLQGAIEYEQKLGVVGKATRASVSLSFAHLLIIGFIVLGNLAMLLERRQKSRLHEGDAQ